MDITEYLRDLPRVDLLAGNAVLDGRTTSLRVQVARQAVERLREAILSGASARPAEEVLIECLIEAETPTLGHVINASGVVLHTGLGRARLAPKALDAVRRATEGHTLLELDAESGSRGDRQRGVRELLCDLTGAEDALVVNNCASAVFLALAALSEGKEVVLSRGQMVEIGGSFRLPEIVVHSGCRLKEVGCTNKVRLADYDQAIGADTGAVLRCHPSNFKIVGFTEEPSLADLAKLTRSRKTVLIDDAGSGVLVDTTAFGLPREPIFGESLKAGADVATASGDKLLGGPQAGLIIGSKAAIARIKSHPIARAVRVDKMSLAALEATLKMYRDGETQDIPTLRYLGRSLDEVATLANRLAQAFDDAVVEEGLSEIGGGSLPGVGVPTMRCGLKSTSCRELARRLRLSTPAVIGRIERELVWLDPRTMEPDEVDTVCDMLKKLA